VVSFERSAALISDFSRGFPRYLALEHGGFPVFCNVSLVGRETRQSVFGASVFRRRHAPKRCALPDKLVLTEAVSS
jgi:hypothetical protein